MARREPISSIEASEERAQEFLKTHRRIVSDFERSLKNARHFIKLAGRSLEQEPEGTVTMIEQIREIDLLRHVTQQFEEYQSVVALLPPVISQADLAGVPAGGLPGEIQSMQARYESLVHEAESQAEDMEQILSALTAPH